MSIGLSGYKNENKLTSLPDNLCGLDSNGLQLSIECNDLEIGEFVPECLNSQLGSQKDHPNCSGEWRIYNNNIPEDIEVKVLSGEFIQFADLNSACKYNFKLIHPALGAGGHRLESCNLDNKLESLFYRGFFIFKL